MQIRFKREYIFNKIIKLFKKNVMIFRSILFLQHLISQKKTISKKYCSLKNFFITKVFILLDS